MYNAQRRGDSWKLNDLRALLFGHYARESKATSSPLAVEGFSRESVKEKLKKMRKACSDFPPFRGGYRASAKCLPSWF